MIEKITIKLKISGVLTPKACNILMFKTIFRHISKNPPCGKSSSYDQLEWIGRIRSKDNSDADLPKPANAFFLVKGPTDANKQRLSPKYRI